MMSIDMYSPKIYSVKFRWPNAPPRHIKITSNENYLYYRIFLHLQKTNPTDKTMIVMTSRPKAVDFARYLQERCLQVSDAHQQVSDAHPAWENEAAMVVPMGVLQIIKRSVDVIA